MNGTDWRLVECKGCGAHIVDAEFCDPCYRKNVDALVPKVYKDAVKSPLPEFVRGARVKRK